jgi:hypothetical protein
LLNAFYQAAHSGLSPSQFGAAFFLPTFIVPFLLITHGLMFRILLREDRKAGLPKGLAASIPTT